MQFPGGGSHVSTAGDVIVRLYGGLLAPRTEINIINFVFNHAVSEYLLSQWYQTKKVD